MDGKVADEKIHSEPMAWSIELIIYTVAELCIKHCKIIQ
jgi:hypothetical protein